MRRYRKSMFDEDARAFSTDENYTIAYQRVKRIKGFYIHVLVYVLVNAFTIISSFNRSWIGSEIFWRWETFSTALFWGIGLFFHGLSVFGKNLFFGDRWEEEKVKEFMEKEKINQKKWE